MVFASKYVWFSINCECLCSVPSPMLVGMTWEVVRPYEHQISVICTMCCVVHTCQYILVLSIEQPRNAENALLSFGYLSAGPSRQRGEYCFEDERKNIVKIVCDNY